VQTVLEGSGAVATEDLPPAGTAPGTSAEVSRKSCIPWCCLPTH